MTRSENDVPIEERYLLLDGVASDKVMTLVREGLPITWPETAICCFLIYAYADVPLGRRYDYIFETENPANSASTQLVIHAATQEFAKPFSEIPHGWKTICLIDFPQGIPPIAKTFPVVDAWGESKQHFLICDSENLQQILQCQEQLKRSRESL